MTKAVRVAGWLGVAAILLSAGCSSETGDAGVGAGGVDGAGGGAAVDASVGGVGGATSAGGGGVGGSATDAAVSGGGGRATDAGGGGGGGVGGSATDAAESGVGGSTTDAADGGTGDGATDAGDAGVGGGATDASDSEASGSAFDASDGAIGDSAIDTSDGGVGGGTSDAGDGIDAVLFAVGPLDAAIPDGGFSVNLPVTDVTVTLLKPNMPTETAGFFVQAKQTGPALFVAVDPATLVPPPALGDVVSFTVTAGATISAIHQATAITGFVRTAVGTGPPTQLQQDVTAEPTLVSAFPNFESEFVRVDGTITSSFSISGPAHVMASIDTVGLIGSTRLKLRLRAVDRDALDLAVGCTFRLNGVMWTSGSGGNIEPSTWRSSDVTVQSCPPPKPVRAAADSASSVLVFFDRQIDGSSVNANGAQFTFDNGLVATGATLTANPRAVRVSLVSAQTAGATYTVIVAPSVKDKLGTQIGLPLGATFFGFQARASLLLNEVNPNITGSADMIELLAASAGYIGDYTLEQDVDFPIVLATLPQITVSMSDIIVVHLNPTAATTTETTSKSTCVAATPSCFSNAWDVRGGATGIVFSNRVLSVRSDLGTVQDATPFFNSTLPAPPITFPYDLSLIQAAGLWSPISCGGVPCSYSSTPAANSVGVAVDWTLCGNSATGNSQQRLTGHLGHSATDWAPAPSTNTWGFPSL